MPENKYENFKNEITNSKADIYFRSLAEVIPHFILIVDPEDYQVQFINRLRPNVTLESVIGASMFDFVWPEYAVLFKQKLDEIKITRKTFINELLGTSSSYPDGKAWYRVQISIVTNYDNSIKSLIFLVEDITEGKLQEFENINKSERIKAIINNTSDIICSIDNDYNLMEFNSTFAGIAKIAFGIELQPGLPVLKFIDPTKHDKLKTIYKRILNGEVYSDIESYSGPSNHTVFHETNYNPIYNSENKISGISIFSKDITDRVKSEQKIKSALKEKEALLAEIHHRIKNNLAMVSSLLQLQEMNINNIEVKEALTISRKRIKSTALIHELLYKSKSFENIYLNDYLTELFYHLKMNENIQLLLQGDDVTLDLDTAMPLGLMLNEIMLNSFKHSYNGHSKGFIEICIAKEKKILTIDYIDFEGTFPDSINFNSAGTTGLTLIHTFAEQLNGSVEMISKTPPKYKIQIPLNENH